MPACREAEEQSRLIGEQARRPCGIRRRLQEGDELFGRVGRRSRIVDRDEVDPPAGLGLERDHEPEEVRIGLRVRAAETGRNPADADEVRAGRVRDARRSPDRRERAGTSLEREEDLPGCELLLMRSSIRSRQLTVVGDELVLDARDLGDERSSARVSSAVGLKIAGISPPLFRARGAGIMTGNAAVAAGSRCRCRARSRYHDRGGRTCVEFRFCCCAWNRVHEPARGTAAERLGESATVLKGVLAAPDKGIPEDLLRKATASWSSPASSRARSSSGQIWPRTPGVPRRRRQLGRPGRAAHRRRQFRAPDRRLGDRRHHARDGRASMKGILSRKFTLGGAAESQPDRSDAAARRRPTPP